MSCTVTLHLPSKLPGQFQDKLGKDIYSADSSGKCYKVTYQKVNMYNSITEVRKDWEQKSNLFTHSKQTGALRARKKGITVG